MGHHHHCSDSSSSKKHCKGACLRTNFVKNNAIFQSELGNSSTPPDPIMAIGPTVAIAMVNRLIGYYERPSMNRVNLETMDTLLPFGSLSGGGDVQVIYDEFSARFFALGWVSAVVSAELKVLTPTGIAGVYKAVKPIAGVLTFNLTGNIVPTVPIDASVGTVATITNGAQISGNIALIKRGGATFASKIQAAQNAGAVGVIFYDNVTGSLPNLAGLPGATIPVITISLADGTLLSSNIPATGTIKDVPRIQQNYMNIAVSKTSAPLSTNDWYKYQFTTNYWVNGNVQADYPKIAVDKERFYIATQDFSSVLNAAVTVLKKNDLVTNFAPALINESSSTFISQKLFPDLFLPQPARIVYSGYKDYLPQFFVTLANYGLTAAGTRNTTASPGLRVFIGASMTNYVDVPFPTTTLIDSGARALQPLSSTGASSAPLETLQNYVLTAVIYKNSLFAAQTILSGTKSIIRWYELDVSKAASYNSISIKQWGDIDTGIADESCFQPGINIDECGNMGIAFSISGPNTLPSFAYTGRLKKDPLGTVRKPYQIIKTSPYPYNGGNQTRTYTTGPVVGNRWEDYIGMVIDPNDHKTFFAFGENSCDDLPPAVSTDVDSSKRALKWTTVMASFNIKKSCGKKTHPSESCSYVVPNNLMAPLSVQEMAPLSVQEIAPLSVQENEFHYMSSTSEQIE